MGQPSSVAADVSGRGALWAHQRYALLLVPQACATARERHGDAAYTYAYGAVSPQDGRFYSLVLPHVNADCMQIFFDEIVKCYPNDNIVMVLDGAGWHRSTAFRLPDNLRLLFLPPYSPELNPQEHLWDELREKYFHNRVFESLDTLEDHLTIALRNLENAPDLVKSITGWDWIINAISNGNLNYTHSY